MQSKYNDNAIKIRLKYKHNTTKIHPKYNQNTIKIQPCIPSSYIFQVPILVFNKLRMVVTNKTVELPK